MQTTVSITLTINRTYVSWQSTFVYVLYDYIHYNCLIMMILLLHCCRLAYKDGDFLNPFPVNMLCVVLQIVPFFLSILIYVEEGASIAVKIISVVSKIVTVAGCGMLTGQLLISMYLVTKLLPYNHAASSDIQLQDARSRLVWTLFYMIIPYLALVPYFVEAVTWIAVMGETKDPTMQKVQVITEVLKYLVDYYRSTWMVVLTMLCLPPYRRAVPLLFCCCGCYQVKVDPLPRKPADTSLMYKHAEAIDEKD